MCIRDSVDPDVHDAILAATNVRGIIVIAAAGNGGTDIADMRTYTMCDWYPALATASGAILVAACNTVSYTHLLAHYSTVIAAAGPQPDTPLRDLAARATFYRGEIHQLCAEVEAAALDYAAALEFDTGPPLVDEIATMQATLPRQEE